VESKCSDCETWPGTEKAVQAGRKQNLREKPAAMMGALPIDAGPNSMEGPRPINTFIADGQF
jgi:hypothetical protein